MTQSERRELAEQFQHEQVDLHQEIDEWREWWRELSELGDPRFGEMADRLHHIRDRLKAHFQHEEQADLFKEIAAKQPKHAEQTERLLAEHKGFVGELDRLCDQLRGCTPKFECWGDAKLSFEEFLNELEAHETEEKKLLEIWSKLTP